MSDQDGRQIAAVPRPSTKDVQAWKAYWGKQGQSWRTEPEIDEERQKYLIERRSIAPDIELGIYPFKDVKLSRADVEWLLATLDGQGPVDWNNERQREREGLDLRGADLREVDLSRLPLAKLRGGVSYQERYVTTLPQRRMAAVHFEQANLFQAHLEEAILRNAHLENTNLEGAYLQRTDCSGAHFESAYMRNAFLDNARLQHTYFDTTTYLANVSLGNESLGYAALGNTRWNGADLTGIPWQQVRVLGDENIAKQSRTVDGKIKERSLRLQEYVAAVRANRQMATVLRDQGLNEGADYFAYRAQKLQLVVFRRQGKFGRYSFSGFFDLLAGYGYRPGRSVLWYLIIIFGFALAYHLLGGLSLYPPDAVVFSIMSFHGRGFFPSLSSETNLHNPLVMLAAVEAIVGLLIEISFIATFTGRFFGK